MKSGLSLGFRFLLGLSMGGVGFGMGVGDFDLCVIISGEWGMEAQCLFVYPLSALPREVLVLSVCMLSLMMLSMCSKVVSISGVGSVRRIFNILVHLIPDFEGDGNFISGISEQSGSISFLSFRICSLVWVPMAIIR